MDVVRSNHVIQDRQFVPFLGLVQPLQIEAAIFRELQQGLPLMAPVSDLPRLTFTK